VEWVEVMLWAWMRDSQEKTWRSPCWAAANLRGSEDGMAREEGCLRLKCGQSMVFSKTALAVDNVISSWDCGWRINAFFLQLLFQTKTLNSWLDCIPSSRNQLYC